MIAVGSLVLKSASFETRANISQWLLTTVTEDHEGDSVEYIKWAPTTVHKIECTCSDVCFADCENYTNIVLMKC